MALRDMLFSLKTFRDRIFLLFLLVLFVQEPALGRSPNLRGIVPCVESLSARVSLDGETNDFSLDIELKTRVVELTRTLLTKNQVPFITKNNLLDNTSCQSVVSTELLTQGTKIAAYVVQTSLIYYDSAEFYTGVTLYDTGILGSMGVTTLKGHKLVEFLLNEARFTLNSFISAWKIDNN